MSNPYVGPRPFYRNDQNLFFGRNWEANELSSLIIAHRLVVFYAQSGSGKTSLLNAKVIPLLEEDLEVWPITRVHGPSFETASLEKIENIYSFYAIVSWVDIQQEDDFESLLHQSIPDFLAYFPPIEDEFGYAKPRVLIFDQFEELFTTHPDRWKERENFFSQISRALENDPQLRVVFSLREDYLASLDPYAFLLPQQMSIHFRLERMKPSAALTAIRNPLMTTSRSFAPDVAEQLVKDLQAIRTTTSSGETSTIIGEFVEPVQLQVVCQNLWEDLPEKTTIISQTELDKFGDVDLALSNFYERALNQVSTKTDVTKDELRKWFENTLITSAGTRGTVFGGKEKTGGIPNKSVELLEDFHILRGEFRAGARWFELTHDRLIEPILTSNRIWNDKKQTKRIRKIKQFAIGVSFIAILLVFLFVFPNWTKPANQNAIAENIRTTATAVSGVLNVTSTAQNNLNAIYTADAHSMAETATEEARKLNATATQVSMVVATERAISTATAISAQATSEFISSEATRTKEELNRLSQPIRPLQPGLSIGNNSANTAGTLGAFVQDKQETFYLLSAARVLGTTGASISQPSPLDSGKLEDVVAYTVDTQQLTPGTIVNSKSLVNLAKIEPNISFQSSFPDFGPIIGHRNPISGEPVRVIGRTSGIVETTIEDCNPDCNILTPQGFTINAAFSLTTPLSSGDEGAIVVSEDGFVVGIVVWNGENETLIAPIEDVLENLNVDLVVTGQELEGFSEDVAIGVYNPDGTMLAAGGKDGYILVWNINDLDSQPSKFTSDDRRLNSIRFSSNSKFLIAGDDAGEIFIWDITKPGSYIKNLHHHESFITGLEIVSQGDSNYLISSSGDGSLDVSDLNFNSAYILRPRTSIDISTEGIWTVVIRPGNKHLASADGRNILLWDIQDDWNTQPISITTHSGSIIDLDFSPDGKLLAYGTTAGIIKVHELREQLSNIVRSTLQTNAHLNTIWDISFSPNGKFLASSGKDGFIRLWEISEDSIDLVAEFPGEGEIFSVNFSPDGNYLVSAGENSAIKLWMLPAQFGNP